MGSFHKRNRGKTTMTQKETEKQSRFDSGYYNNTFKTKPNPNKKTLFYRFFKGGGCVCLRGFFTICSGSSTAKLKNIDSV